MSRNTQRSAFAESAYADAERRESSRLRREEIDEYNLLYYDDGTNDDHYSQSNVVHAEFQPLAGKVLLKLQLVFGITPYFLSLFPL